MENTSIAPPTVPPTTKENNKNSNTVESLSYYKRPLSPAHELLVWERWVRIRKEETSKIGKRVRRDPVDLAMNMLANYREEREWKTAIEHAEIGKKPRLRGHIYENDCRLKQCCECAPVYAYKKTAAELGHPNVIEYVSVPAKIKETELGMSGEPHRPPCTLLDATYNSYRKKREKDIAKSLQKIYPFKPSGSKLMIQGYKPRPPSPKIPPLPNIIITEATQPPQTTISEVFALRINKSFWYKESFDEKLGCLSPFKKETWHENCTTWTYYFNVPIKKIGRGKIFLQNLGTVALRYCWQQIVQPIPFAPVNNDEPVFFFNKNEDLLPPGQNKYVNITFVSDKPGAYSRIWELVILNVNFFDTNPDKFTFMLYADATENAEEIKRKVEILKTRIHQTSLSNFGIEILNTVLDSVFVIVPQTYPYKKYFVEAQLFVMKNPVCFYHQTEVGNMAMVYNDEFDAGEWDLSIKTWRNVMMSKEFDDRMRYFAMLKKSHADLLKPWYEGDELVKEKQRAMNNLWAQLANNLDATYTRLNILYANPFDEYSSTRLVEVVPEEDLDPITQQKIHNVFYLHAYDYVADTIEQLAGLLSSLDSDRWIQFDFCRS